MKAVFLPLFLFFLYIFSNQLEAQIPVDSTLPSGASLNFCIQYALKHQPLLQQSLIDEEITESTIKSKLADWYPQVNFNYNLQHNFQVQTSIIGGNPVRLGVSNTSAAQFSLSQNLFSRDALLAFQSQGDVRTQARQTTESRKIDVVVNVSKAFYDVITTQQQIKVSEENIIRLERSLKNAYDQYKAGLTDKTDYKRATIALNNTKAQNQSNRAALSAKIEYLKALMGYPEATSLTIEYDSLRMEKDIYLDTVQIPSYTDRIEYRLLETQKKLQEANLKYYKWAFLPTASLNGAYNMNFLNNEFSQLYNTNYPNSFAALTLSFPIFQGGKRNANIETARWQLKRTDLDIVNLKNNIHSQYATALASYKSSLANYIALKENLSLAQEVYDVINLQYRSGVKTYLEVITSETDLRAAQINYYNALFLLMASKIDVQKALGQIIY